MALFELNISTFFLNERSIDEKEFIPTAIKQIKSLTASNDSVDVTFNDKTKKFDRLSPFSDYKLIEKALKEFVEENYTEYDITSDKNTVNVYALDDDDNDIVFLNAIGQAREIQQNNQDSIVQTDDVVDVDAHIPTLTNKSYTSFVDLCSEAREFLNDYGEIGKLRTWMLKKTNVNAIAKAIFAPIKAWDYVGVECKMTQEDFNAIKTNLVQYSIDNACVSLGEFSWNDVFDWIRERKTNAVKCTGSGDNFVAKIRTTVFDKKTKQKLGIIIATLSIVVDRMHQVQDLQRGNLPVLESNISFNLIAR